MIKLSKSDVPTVLSNNAASWLSEFKEAISEGDKKKIAYRKSRYNHADIKEAVVRETSGKCAYCEADVVATSHGDIEHIYPKSLDVNKTFEWSNLGFACQKCNQNKSDSDPNSEFGSRAVHLFLWLANQWKRHRPRVEYDQNLRSDEGGIG